MVSAPDIFCRPDASTSGVASKVQVTQEIAPSAPWAPFESDRFLLSIASERERFFPVIRLPVTNREMSCCLRIREVIHTMVYLEKGTTDFRSPFR